MARLFVCQLPAVVYRASQSESIGREPLLTTRANLGKERKEEQAARGLSLIFGWN